MNKSCLACGQSYAVKQYAQRFCSKSCCTRWHNTHRELKPNIKYICVVCGAIVLKYLEPSKQASTAMKFCSRQCKGKVLRRENHPMWNGGKSVNDQGYVLVHAPNHPLSGKRKYVREHRLVVEQALGRYLLQEEVVHHINGDRQDNRLENLQLYTNNAVHKREDIHQRQRDNKGRFLPLEKL